MFLPLYDGVPLLNLKTPLTTRSIIGVCIGVYLITSLSLSAVAQAQLYAGLGLIPAVLFGTAALPPGLPYVPEPLTLVTSLFLHGSAFHLIGNMLFLWVFGDNVEDAMGSWRFLAFFLLCGVAGGLAHAFLSGEQESPIIGASGAIAGVVAAYLILYPRVKLWGLFLSSIPLHVPAYGAIGFWIVFQIVSVALGGDNQVGWYAHLGGLLAGALLIPLMRRRYDPVLARVEVTERRLSA
jgi:membrane associated rhomboid family serine protease